jgi:hypothetical protein
MLTGSQEPTFSNDTHGQSPGDGAVTPGGGALAAESVTVAVAEPITWSGIALHGGALPGYSASWLAKTLWKKATARVVVLPGAIFSTTVRCSGVSGPHRHGEPATHFKLLNQRRR